MKVKYNDIYDKFEIEKENGKLNEKLYSKKEIKELFGNGAYAVCNSADEIMCTSDNIAFLCTMMSVQYKNGYIIQK